MNPFIFFWKSSIGKKWLVALTGLVLIGYVIGHMVGNLQIFMAPEQINSYARFLHSQPQSALGGARLPARLLLSAYLHDHQTGRWRTALRARRNTRSARRVQATWASRTMAISGLVVLAFIVFHLLHFTVRDIDRSFRARADGGILATEYDVHTMVISGFTGHPAITAFYLIGLFLLCLHLSHGFSSLLQTRRPEFQTDHGADLPRRPRARVAHLCRIRLHPGGGLVSPPQNRATMIGQLDSNIPAGPLGQKWEQHKFDSRLINPANRRKYEVIVVGSGLAGGGGGRDARRAGLRGEMLLLPGQPAPRAFHRRAGRDQRRQELPERRRLGAPALLRHDQRRRLPLAGGERASAGGDLPADHRSKRGARRPFRAGVRRPAGESLLRRRAGFAHLLRAGPDGPAAAARRVLRARAGRSRPAR